jgi:hypothetical protein
VSDTTEQSWHYDAIPDRAERQRRNTALLAAGADTGFYDDHGRPAPWPDDIDEWRPSTGYPLTTGSGQKPS